MKKVHLVKKISIPNKRGQGQQRAAWAKPARAEAPNQQIEESTRQTIAGREWLFQQR